MNAERLKSLKERADHAVKIAAEIESIQSADASRWSGPFTYLMKDRIIKAGCAAVLADLERQLESLLAPETPDPVEVVTERANGFRRTDAKQIQVGEWAKPAVTFPPAVIVDKPIPNVSVPTIADVYPPTSSLETAPLH